VTIMKAKQGDEESREMVETENTLRKEKGLPSVEQELKAMVKTDQ